MIHNTTSAAPASGSMTLDAYYASVKESRERGPLTLEEADRLALAATDNDPAVSKWAAEKLMKHTMGVVPVVVRRATGGARMDSYRREELYQVALMALYESLSRWNPGLGHWRTFATRCAEGQVRIEFSSGMTEVPVRMRAELQRAASDVLRERATFEEASQRGGVSEVTLAAAVETSRAAYLSKDQEFGEAGDTYTIEIEDKQDDFAQIFEADISERIEWILVHLSDTDRKIICQKYGLCGCQKKPVFRIGAELGIERSALYGRVERIERRLKFGLAQRLLVPESNHRDRGRAAA